MSVKSLGLPQQRVLCPKNVVCGIWIGGKVKHVTR